MEIILTATPPFSLSTVIHSHGWIELAPFTILPDGEGFSYIDQLNSGRVVNLKIGDRNNRVVIDPGVQLAPDEQNEIIEKVKWMLGLDQDFSEFYKLTDQEPKLAKARMRAQGRVLRSPTLFEDAIKTILTTNTIWGSTRRMVERLVNEFGSSLPEDLSIKAFPKPEQISGSDPDILRSTIRLGYRAPYVYQLSVQLAGGEMDLESLKQSSLTTSEILKILMGIKGVGNYAAANLLMLLGRYDYIPIDSYALKVVSREWYDGQPIGPDEIMTAFDRWGKWKGLAFWQWEWSVDEN